MSDLGSSVLSAMEEHITEKLPMVRAVLVARGNDIIYERGFGGASLDAPVEIYSCTKGIMSMLVGMLLKEGRFPPLFSYVSKIIPRPPLADRAFETITIAQCMDGTIGYRPDFGDYDVARALQRPPDRSPGSAFFYNDIGPQLVSQVIGEVTGMTASAFADRALFPRIGIEAPYWLTAEDGQSVGGWGIMLRPREMLSFGRFALARGRSDGEDLVDPTFFDASISPQNAGGFPGHDQYGYLWWVSDRHGRRTHYALGFGGQLICVCPEEELVAAISCTRELGADIAPAQDLYFDYLLPG